MNQQRRYLLALLALSVLALVVRLPHWLDRPLGAYTNNEDAASHVLATVVAYDRVPSAEHHFVPLFTMGEAHDLWIDDLPTASRMSKAGYNYYTSWPPGFFVLAWAAHRALGVEPTPASLRALNLCLHYGSAALLLLLGYSLAKRQGADVVTRWAAGVAASAMYVAAPEALESHLFSFWAEQVYQPLLLLQLLAFLHRERWQALVGLVLLAVVGGMIDWSAYVASGGFVLAFGWLYWRERRTRWLWAGLAVGAAIVVAGLLLFAWLTSKVSLSELLAAQHYRAETRTGGVRDYAKLLFGYVKSFGPLLILLVPILRAKLPLKRFWAALVDRPLLFVAAFPVFENLILANHAAIYAYDRLKAVSLAALLLAALIGSGLASVPRLWRATMACAAACLAVFALMYTFYRPASAPALKERMDLARLIGKNAGRDEIAFVNDTVRGHTLYYAKRNVVEVNDAKGQAHIDAQVTDWLRRRGFAKGVLFRVARDFKSVRVVRYGVDGPRSEAVLPVSPPG